MVDAVTPIAGGSANSIQTAQQLSNLVDSLFGTSQNTSTSGTTTNSSAADGPLQQIIAQLMQQIGMGNNDPAIQGLIQNIFTQFKEGAMPQIQGMGNAAGVYNSSTQKLLQNDALARAVGQAGGLAVQHQSNLQTQLATLLSVLAKSTQSTQQNQNQNTSKPGSAANLGKAAAGAAAAKALKDIFSGKGKDTAGDGDPEKGGSSTINNSDDSGDPVKGGSNTDYGDSEPGGSSEGIANEYNEDFFASPNSQDLTGEQGDSEADINSFGWLADFFSGSDAVGSGLDVGGDTGGFGDSNGDDFGESF